MKKAFIVMFCMIISLSFVTLVGCGGSSDGGGDAEAPLADSPYVGMWQAVSADFNDEEIDIDELLEGKDFIITLNDDGTAVVTDTEGDSEAAWKEIDGGVKVKGDEINMKFKDTDDGKLTCKILGVHMYFEKVER